LLVSCNLSAVKEPIYGKVDGDEIINESRTKQIEGKSDMPKLTVEGVGTFEVPEGKKLVLALADEVGIDQLHACGGKSKCTTCKVEFISGEPSQITEAESNVLQAKGLINVRLSCQILCDHDMEIRAISRLEGSGRADVGGRPTENIVPEPIWIERS